MAALPDLADAAYLTALLRRNGLLAGGRVHEVKADPPRDMILSRIVRLRLAYEGAADGAPASLIVKSPMPRSVGPAAWAEREVAFYNTVAPATPTGLLVRCLDAQFPAETKDWHILMEDLGDTHMLANEWPLPPSEAQCRAIVGTLARFQAAWWDDARLGTSIGTWIDESVALQSHKDLEQYFATFVDRLGDRLSAERRGLYERYFAAGPRGWPRYASRRHLTVVHGDAHVWNFFVPKEGDPVRGTLLFDWDGWRPGLATTDLAYMMAIHWYPERRRRFERPLLDHYHATLTMAGVQGYGRDALDDDYGLAVLTHLMRPLLNARIGIPPVIWWSHLERIFLAIDDLGCRELLD